MPFAVPSSLGRLLRRGLLAIVVLVLGLAGVSLLLQTSPARRLVRDRVVGLAEARTGLRIQIDEIEYDFVPLALRARNLRVLAPEAGLQIDIGELQLQSSWRSLASYRAIDGRSIRQATLSKLRILRAKWDEPFTVSVDIETLSMSPRDGAWFGQLEKPSTLSATIQGHPLTGDLSGMFAVHSRGVELDRLRFDSSAGSALEVSGWIDTTPDGRETSVDFYGQASREALIAWPAVADRIDRPVTFAGRISGPIRQPRAAVHLDARILQRTRVENVSLLADLSLADETLQIDRLLAEARRGHVDATGRVALPPRSGGSLTMTFRDLDLQRFLSDADAPVRTLLAGSLAGQAIFEWPRLEFDALRATVNARAIANTGAKEPGAEGTLHAELADSRYYIRHDLTALSVRAIGELRGRVNSGNAGRSTVDGEVILDSADLARSLESARRVFRLSATTRAADLNGEASARLSISGTAASPTVDAAVEAPTLAFGDRPPWAARFDLHVGRDIVSVSALEASQSTNLLQGSASIERRTKRLTGEVSANLREIDSDLLQLDGLGTDDGTVQVAATVGGTLDRPEIVSHGTASGFMWRDARLGTLPFSAQIVGPELHVAAGAPDFATVLTLATTLGSGWPYQATLATTDASVPALTVFAPAAAGTITGGTVSLTARASGRLAQLSESVGTAEVSALTVETAGSSVSLEEPVIVEWSPTGGSLSKLVLHAGQTRLVMSGSVSGAGAQVRADVALDGTADDLVPLASVLHADIPEVSGPLVLRATWDSARAHPLEGDARIGPLTASVSGTRVWDISAGLGVRDGVLALQSLEASDGAASLKGSGDLPLELMRPLLPRRTSPTRSPGDRPARFEGRLELSVPAMLRAFLPRENAPSVTGTVAAGLTFESWTPSLADLRGQVRLETATLSIGDVPLTISPSSEATVGDGRLTVPDIAIDARGGRLVVGGLIDLSTATPSLDLAVNGTTDLRPASAVLPFTVIGTAATALRIAGPLDRPAVEGELTLRDAGMLIREPRLALSDISGVIRGDSGTIRIGPLTGSANGGSVALQGMLAAGSEDDQLQATFSGVDVELFDGLRALVNADLAWHAAGPSRGVRGRISVEEGSYEEPFSLALTLLAAIRRAAPRREDPSSWSQSLPLDVAVTTEHDIHVDDSSARVDVGVDLRLHGTLADAALGGEMRAREGGEILLGANVYRLVEGRVAFRNPARIVPSVEVTAETRVGEYDIVLDISGTADRINARVHSTPPLPQRDLISLLATGRSDPLGGSSSRTAQDQALAVVSGNALALAGRAIGFDAVRIGNTDLELVSSDIAPTTRLSVSKMLGPRVELVYSQALEDHNVAWVIIIRPRRGLQFRITARDDDSGSLEFRQELSLFDRRAAQDPPPRQDPPRVASVRVVDRTTGADLGHLKDRLDLTEGDGFSLERWQKDRDRLERYFRDARYWNAQIRSTRRTDSAGSLTLQYEITQGPLSVLSVQGARLPGRVLDRLRDAWMRSVYDAFLQEDLRRIAREYMIDSGHVQATVTVQIADAAGGREKIAEVAVAPGRSYQRRIVFSGNLAIPSSELEEVLASQDLQVRAWLEPGTVAAALTRLYHDRGFLNARVNPNDIVFTDDTARLPFTIEEGPAFTVSGIELAGNRGLEAAALRSTLSVKPGGRYTSDTERTLRQEVENDYLRQGFSEVQTETRSQIDRDAGAVSLTVDVTEGARQVVRDVDIEGVRPRTASLVERTLEVTPGAPVNPEAWEAARGRIYELGQFRSVDLTATPLGSPTPSRDLPGVSEQPVRADVAVEEWSGVRLRYGILLDDLPEPGSSGRTYAPGGAIDVQHRNAFGRNLTLGLGTSYTTEGWNGRLLMSRPRLLGLPGVTNLYLSRSSDTQSSDQVRGENVESGFVVEQRARARNRVDLALSYRLERQNVRLTARQEPGEPSLDIDGEIGRINATIAYDSRNSLFDARRGWLHSSSFDYGANALGSRIGFTRYVGQQLQYLPIGPFTLATGLRLGLLDPSAFDVNLLDLRFDAGGGTTVRGYREDELSAETFHGVALGGNALLILNAELRFPTPLNVPLGRNRMRISSAVFVDAGNTFPTVSQLSLGELAKGVGFGLRFDSPVGLLRLDLGFPVPRPNGSPRVRWHFGIGQAF